MVEKNTLQAHKEQPSGEGHTSSDVVQRFGMVHLAQTEADPSLSPSSALPPLINLQVLSLQASRPSEGEAGREHLEVANHHEACSVGAACDERRGVNPGVPALLQKLPIAKEADQGH